MYTPPSLDLVTIHTTTMKTFLAIVTGLVALVMFIFGTIYVFDSDITHKYEYVKPALEEYMTRNQQFMLGIGMILLALLLLAFIIGYPWPWVRRRDCVDCLVNKTRYRDEQGLPVCSDCEDKRIQKELIRKAEEKAAGQPQMKCPADGALMERLVLKETEIVIDVCPHCKGAWLEADEITQLEEALDQPSGSGSFSSGMIIGMAIG